MGLDACRLHPRHPRASGSSRLCLKRADRYACSRRRYFPAWADEGKRGGPELSYADSEQKIASGLATEAVAKPSAGVRSGSRSLLLVPTATLIVGLLLTGALVWV